MGTDLNVKVKILERLKIPLKMFVGQMEQEAGSLVFCENLVSGKIEDWARFVGGLVDWGQTWTIKVK